MQSRMLQRWLRLCDRVGASGNRIQQYHELAYYYTHPRRKYHTLGHIKHCLREFDRAIHLIDNPNGVELALWFHDAIYETWAKDNEKKSADLARFFITKLMGLKEELASGVANLIYNTAYLSEDLPSATSHDGKFMVDIDLSTLGAEENEFDRNSKDVRHEFSWVEPLEFYGRERARVLRVFLDKPHIYMTEFFGRRYEAQARANLVREIKRLEDIAIP